DRLVPAVAPTGSWSLGLVFMEDGAAGVGSFRGLGCGGGGGRSPSSYGRLWCQDGEAQRCCRRSHPPVVGDDGTQPLLGDAGSDHVNCVERAYPEAEVQSSCTLQQLTSHVDEL